MGDRDDQFPLIVRVMTPLNSIRTVWGAGVLVGNGVGVLVAVGVLVGVRVGVLVGVKVGV